MLPLFLDGDAVKLDSEGGVHPGEGFRLRLFDMRASRRLLFALDAAVFAAETDDFAFSLFAGFRPAFGVFGQFVKTLFQHMLVFFNLLFSQIGRDHNLFAEHHSDAREQTGQGKSVPAVETIRTIIAESYQDNGHLKL